MRGDVDFEGIALQTATYKADGGLVSAVLNARGFENDGREAVVGKAVTIAGDGEVGFGSEGDAVLGKVVQFETDEHVTVQYGGYTEFEGVSGSLPTAGDWLVVDGSGAVLASAGAPSNARAVAVDSSDLKIMVLLG